MPLFYQSLKGHFPSTIITKQGATATRSIVRKYLNIELIKLMVQQSHNSFQKQKTIPLSI